MKEIVIAIILIVSISCLATDGFGIGEAARRIQYTQPTPTPSPDPVDEGVKEILVAVAGQVDAGTEAIQQDTQQSGAPYRTVTIAGIVAAVVIVGYLVIQNESTRALLRTYIAAQTARLAEKTADAAERTREVTQRAHPTQDEQIL